MPKTLMCDPKLFEKDLDGRTYIVTGANSGAGFATTKQLAEQGAQVIGACRRVDAGKEAFADLDARGSVEIMELDLASLESVRKFAEVFLAKYDRLNGLVNNAGVMMPPKGTTVDGCETQFGITDLIREMVFSLNCARFKPCFSISSHASAPKLPEPVIIATFLPLGKGWLANTCAILNIS